jgi:hypothetical protein
MMKMISKMIPLATYAAEAETGAGAAEAETDESKRIAVSKREYINEDGTEAETPMDCAGFAYTILNGKNNVNEGEIFKLVRLYDDVGEAERRAFYAFAGFTLAGNVTNQVRNGTAKANGPATEHDALTAWLENLDAGNWTSPRGELTAGLGSLAEAYVQAMAKEGVELNESETLEKLKAADADKRKAVRNDPRVRAVLTQIIAAKAAAKAAEAAGPIVAL